MLVTCDFETFYGTGYSLRSQTTEEYIRDPRFQVIGMALKIDDGPSVWYSGDMAYLRSVLAQIDWSNAAFCAHNAMFDAAILSWRFGFQPRRYIDTMSMARGLVGLKTRVSLAALGEFFQLKVAKGDEVVKAFDKRLQDFTPSELAAYGAYCVNDNEMCYQLLQIMAPMTQPEELQLQDWTIRCFAEPKLVLDREILDRELEAYKQRKFDLLLNAGVVDISSLRSDTMMAQLLSNLGVDPPTKWSPKQKKTVFAFSKQDVAFMDLQDHEDEAVVALVEARLGLKTSILQTRIERLIGISTRGLMPMPLAYAGAVPTRRWAGTDKINVQNFPRSTKTEPSPLRRAIKAPPGKRMAAADLSQIELRVNCWQAGQTDTLALLRGGGDTYSVMASDIFGFEVNKHDHPTERFVGKTAELGCGYQCGGAKFQHMLKTDSRKYKFKLDDTSLEFAQGVVNTYRSKKTAIKNFWYRAGDALELMAQGRDGELGPYRIRDHQIYLPNGLPLYYPDLRFTEKEGDGEIGCEWTYARMWKGHMVRNKIYGGKFVENITQHCARLFVSDALLRLDKLRYGNGERIFDIVFSVHDELVVLFADGLDEQWVRDTLTWALTTPPWWALDLPLACEIGIGDNYAECK